MDTQPCINEFVHLFLVIIAHNLTSSLLQSPPPPPKGVELVTVVYNNVTIH